MQPSRPVLLAAMIAVLVVLSGCATGQPAATSTTELLEQAHERSDAQAIAALADLVVTREEVDAAAERRIQCYRDAGLTVDDLGVNPFDSWTRQVDVLWPGMSEAEGMDAMAACDRGDYELIAQGYALMEEDEVDPAVLPGVVACLERAGIAVAEGVTSMDEMIPADLPAGRYDAIMVCATAAATEQGFEATSFSR